jgi:DNA polymerase III beta subunit
MTARAPQTPAVEPEYRTHVVGNERLHCDICRTELYTKTDSLGRLQFICPKGCARPRGMTDGPQTNFRRQELVPAYLADVSLIPEGDRCTHCGGTGRMCARAPSEAMTTKVVVDRSSLLAALTRVARNASKRSPIPVLQHVRLDPVAANTVRLEATDLDHWVVTSASVQEASGDSVLIPAQRFLDVVNRVAPGSRVTLTAAKGRATITADSGRFELPTLEAHEWPAGQTHVPAMRSTVPSGELASAIASVETHVDRDQDGAEWGRCALLDIRPAGSWLVGANRHRLARSFLASLTAETPLQLVIPRPALTTLKTIFTSEETLHIEASTSALRVCGAVSEVTVRLSGDRYPPYEQLFASKVAVCIEVEPAVLRAAVDRVSLFTNDHSRVQFWLVDDGAEPLLRLEADSPDLGHGTDSVPVTIVERLESKPEAGRFGVNARYLADGLSALGSPARVRFKIAANDTAPILINDVDPNPCDVLVMPMRDLGAALPKRP